MTEVRTSEAEEIAKRTRTYSDWSSPRGLRKDILPWRLWEKAKKLGAWDPADIDFSEDARQWKDLDEDMKITVSGLARGFMVGEEGVTLDILPLVMAIADEGRTEETMFLTTFAYEEAKHVDFFRRWYDAIGADPIEFEKKGRERMRARGVEPPEWEREQGLFEYHLPRVMRRLLVDQSPEAFLDCGITYNQFIEGCLAIAGYSMWNRVFENLGVFPGLQEGLAHVQRDERRHIAYGTFLCRRLIAANPRLVDWAKDRMYRLRDGYLENLQAAEGDGSENGQGSRNGEPESPEEQFFGRFREKVVEQVDRRVTILEKAAGLTADQAELGEGTEEAEESAEELLESA